ncbi:MAG: hypothetical protein ACRD1S_00930 [Vicinamibacterales bacterium]
MSSHPAAAIIAPGRGRGKSRRSLALIEAAREILAQIQPATIRAVCYRLFTMSLIGSMAKGETNRVSTQLTWARERGVIPWRWIVDETREAERVNAFTDPQDYIEVVKRSYRRDGWTDQPEWVEVWSEKGTIRGTLAPVLNTYGVTFRVMHGYGSATAVYQAAQDSLSDDEKLLTVLYVGDHDPSGLHMSELDLPRRLKAYGGVVDFIRLALTTQDTESGLPSFATVTKRHDARFRWYLQKYGSRCWELDALSPVILRQRVEQTIVERLDQAAWHRAEITERAECESLATVLNAWPGAARSARISGQAPK